MDMSSYSQIMSGREELLTSLKEGKREWGDCAAINIIYEDSTHVSPNQACHAGLANTHYNGFKKKGAIAVVSALMKPKPVEMLEEEEAFFFLDWLLNRSPYAETFITKSADEALYYKATISSAFHPSNLMAAGMVASRRLWEYPVIARVMVALSKAGVNEDLAYYLAHLFAGRFDKVGNCSWSDTKSAHCSVNPAIMGKKELLAFLQHKPTKLNKTYNEHYQYSGYDAMYGESWNDACHNIIHKNFPYKGAVKAVDVNPFPKDNIAGVDLKKSAPYQDCIDRMADYQHIILNDIGYNKKEMAA